MSGGPVMHSRGPSSGGSGGNDPNEKENYEEYMRRQYKKGEYKGLAWIVLAHAPTTHAYIYIYIYMSQPVPSTCIHF